MRVLEELQEDVFRFRVQHRYDYRFMFLLFDLIMNIAKISLFVGFIYVLWLAGGKVLGKLDVTTGSTPTTYPTTVAQAQFDAATEPTIKEPVSSLASVSVELGNQSDAYDSASQEIEGAALAAEPAVQAALPEPVLTVATSTVPAEFAAVEPEAEVDSGTVVTEIPALAPPPINRDAVVLDDAWIRDQPGSKFTIQIGSTPNLLFLRRLGLLLPGHHERAVYHYKNKADGTPEYGLAWGVFESVAAAQLELASLDDYSKRYGPWIRRVQGIQRQMDNR